MMTSYIDDCLDALPVAAKGQIVLVLGAGKTGLSIVRWFAGKGVTVVLADSHSDAPGIAQIRQEFPKMTIYTGPFNDCIFTDVDMVVSSPGVPLKEIPLQKLKKSGVPVIGDVEIFLRENVRQRGGNVIAITGTNGKSTVTQMVESVLNACGLDVVAVGNIGIPVLDVLVQIELGLREMPDVFVLELSSFQIDTTYSFQYDASVVLNVSEDHLDRYRDFEAYMQSKFRIYSGRGAKVVNRDDLMILNATSDLNEVITFGLSPPDTDRSWGVSEIAGDQWIVRGQQQICRCRDLRVPGAHNVCNALAAFALCSTLVCVNEAAVKGLLSYEGLDHRMQWIADVSGVRFYNDSKATNVSATAAAISGMPTRCVLLLGGQSKKQTFDALVDLIRQKVRAVVLIGQDAKLIRQGIESSGVTIFEASDLKSAVRIASRVAEPGEIVLFSPACASFDMFENYAHRGDVFADAVRSLV
ncbi:UDP-N-acetylmuramoyl-L-alanine--D-glutamate ligase [Burkholderiales bacterium]|nr:UDP-N-acetylmuramoyl-L-alanine--D-glutamate ligase [Burkholderiales bacterium]